MYIGIIGHSGEDKMNIAHLYGNTLSWILEHPGHETPTLEFIKDYYSWCESLSDDSNWVKPDIYYASFAHPLKAIVSMITGIPFELLSSHDTKCSYIINIKTFEYKPNDGKEEIISPEKLFRQRNKKLSLEYDDKQELPDCWMFLNDYVIYFGYYLCRNYLGKDVWVNVERISNKNFPPNDGYRIYPDIRSMSEYQYIKDMGGVLIRINQSKEANSVINDYSLFNVDVDIDMGWYSDVRGLYDEIYSNCYELCKKSNSLII